MPDSDDRIAALYRASRPRLQPPPELDHSIRDAAHRAVRRQRRLGYQALALAATLVLGVGLAWLQLGVPPQPGLLAPEPDVEGDVQPAPPAPPAPADATMRSLSDEPAVPAAAMQSERQHRGVAAKAVPAPLETQSAGCDLPPESAPSAWLQALDRARAAGDEALVDCLEQAYRERFGDQRERLP